MSTRRASKAEVGRANATRGTGLTTADLVVLSLISERPMHGYELVREYERQEVADWAMVSRAHVYYALQKLADCGHIEALQSAGARDGRGKAVYRVTQAGKHALSAALGSEEWAQDRTPTAFNTWSGLAIHAREADRRRVLAARRVYLEHQIAKEQRSAADIAVDHGRRASIAAVMVGLCIEQFETELRWLAALEKVLLVSG